MSRDFRNAPLPAEKFESPATKTVEMKFAAKGAKP